jgi:hypothetical protein
MPANNIIGAFRLVEVMRSEGFPLPENCREARLIMGVDNAFMMQYDVFLTDETLAQLGRSLQRLTLGPCEECEGRGGILDAPANVLDGHPYYTTCTACDGTGHPKLKETTDAK